MSEQAKHEQAITDEITPNDATINDNLCVTKTVSIGVCNTDAKLSISDPSFRGKMKLFTTSGTGHDFGYDGGIDNFFAFAHIGLESGQTKFVWHPNEGSTRDLLTIKNTGNIGIGTSEPKAPLHVANYMVVGPFAATNGQGGIEVTGPVAEFSFVRRNLTSWPTPPAAGDRFVWYNPEGTARLWTEVNGDLLTVTAGGNVGIGTTPQHARVMIQAAAVPLAFRESDRSVTEGGLWRMPLDAGMLRFDVNTSAAGNFSPYITPLTMYPNGNVHVGGVLTQASSRELKENIAELSGQEAIETLENLNPIKFSYKADNNNNLHIGFIAEDVPELVATSDRKGLSSMDIVAVLTKALQEQQKTIAALADKVNMLESQTA